MIANWRLDAPWSSARNRTSLLLSLTIAGFLAGAFHAFIVGLGREPGGDALHWERIDIGAELGIVPGLATGLAVILSRRWWCRTAMAAILGAILYILLALLYGATFPPVRLSAWQDVLLHPIGPALLQMAPTSSCLALSVHLFRTCAGSLRGILLSWALSVILGIQSQSLYWFAVHASYLKNPFDSESLLELLRPAPLRMGGLVFAMCAGTWVFILELAALRYQRSKAARWITPAAAAVAILIASGLHLLSQTMPLTPPSAIEAIAFGPDGRTLVTAHVGDTLRLWEIRETDEKSEPIALEIKKVRLTKLDGELLSFATNGRQVLVTGFKGRIQIFDAKTLEPSAEINRAECRFGVSALSRDGTSMAAIDHMTQDIWLWQNTDTARPFGTNPLLLSSNGPQVDCLGFTPDERLLVGIADTRRVLVWEVSTGALLWEYPYTEEVETRSTTTSVHAQRAVVGTHANRSRPGLLWMDEECRVFKIDSQVLSLDACPEDRQCARTNGVALSISDLIAGETVHWAPRLGASEMLRVLTYSPDGHLIATGSSGGRVQIFRAPAFDAD